MFHHRLLTSAAFAIVDSASLQVLPESIRFRLLCPDAMRASAHLMPAAVLLAPLLPNESGQLLGMIDAAHERQEQPPIALFVTSKESPESFVEHWNSLQLRRSNSGATWLRLHDPRVLHQMVHMFNPPQRSRLFGAATVFDYCLHGQWLQSEKPDRTAVQEASAKGAVSLWDWSRIERIGLMNRALLRAEMCSAKEWFSAGQVAESLIQHAALLHGFDEQDDLIEYAFRGLRFGHDFGEHLAIKHHLRPQPGDTDSRLCDRLALVEHDVWLALEQRAASNHQGVPS